MKGARASVGVLLALLVMGPSAHASLPAALVARLESDRARADAALAQQRTALATVAAAQRTAAADAAHAEANEQLLSSVAALVGADLPDGFASTLDAVRSSADDALQEQEARLEDATRDAAAAQATALDADRRIRALQRASATEDERDATLGSWRFGSGGPAVSADTLDRYLESKGSPLAGQGAAILKAGVEHEVDPRLVVAIAGAESYFGITTCAPYNGWGWGCPSNPFAFRSWAHAVDTVAQGLREGYLDDDLTSVGEIHLRYAPPNAANDPDDLNYAWADNVARFLVEQGGDPQHVDGVLGPSR